MRVPLGVVGVIYENRPNVTSDSAGLCLKAGNATMLRGSSSALRSNRVVVSCMRDALSKAGLPEDAVILVEQTDHESAVGVHATGRGARLPDPARRMSLHRIGARERDGSHGHRRRRRIATSTWTGPRISRWRPDRREREDQQAWRVQRGGVTRSFTATWPTEFLPSGRAGDARGRARRATSALGLDRIAAGIATADDYATRVPVLEDVRRGGRRPRRGDRAHTRDYGSGHSEAIITRDVEAAEIFVRSVDAAAVLVNASTRFVDGGELGLGAEIGISTQKLHARGPMGLEALTCVKYVIVGDGHVR